MVGITRDSARIHVDINSERCCRMGFVYVSKRNTLLLTIRVRKVEITPEPGPISTIKAGSICLIKEYSFSSASRKRNESWSGS